jgi:hypothetical protein
VLVLKLSSALANLVGLYTLQFPVIFHSRICHAGADGVNVPFLHGPLALDYTLSVHVILVLADVFGLNI